MSLRRECTFRSAMLSRWRTRMTGCPTMPRSGALSRTSTVRRVQHWPGWSPPRPAPRTGSILALTLLVSSLMHVLFHTFSIFLFHIPFFHLYYAKTTPHLSIASNLKETNLFQVQKRICRGKWSTWSLCATPHRSTSSPVVSPSRPSPSAPRRATSGLL